MPGKAKPKKNLSALKRVRQSLKRNLRNKAVRTSLKTLVKKVESAVSSGNREEASKALKEVIKAFSRAASKGIIHRNNASRKISKLTRKVNTLFKAEAA
ncbi:MAG: 30S ribosomal protein S20 [Thermodesulfovibrionales bacterium]